MTAPSVASTAGLFAALMLGGIGCDGLKSSSPLVEVSGQVITTRGEPIQGGVVEFDGFTGRQQKAQSEIGADGTFNLRTVGGDGRRFLGVPEGMYRCNLVLIGHEQHSISMRLPQSYKVQKDMKLPLLIIVPRLP